MQLRSLTDFAALIVLRCCCFFLCPSTLHSLSLSRDHKKNTGRKHFFSPQFRTPPPEIMSFPFSRAPFSRLAPRPSTMPRSLARYLCPAGTFHPSNDNEKKRIRSSFLLLPSDMSLISCVPSVPLSLSKSVVVVPGMDGIRDCIRFRALLPQPSPKLLITQEAGPSSPIGDSVLFADFIRRGEQRRAMLRTTAGRKMRSPPPCIIIARRRICFKIDVADILVGSEEEVQKVFMSMTIIPCCSPGSRIIGTHSRVTPSPPCSFFPFRNEGEGGGQIN